jgi:hypothetical protein
LFKGIWNLWIQVFAPAILIGGIASAAKMGRIQSWVFIIAGVTVHQVFRNLLERRHNLNITAKTTFIIPEDMDPEDIANLIRLNENTLKVVEGNE